MKRDPVCGMEVDETKSLTLVKDGERYFFCSAHCLEKFQKSYGGTPEPSCGGTCPGAPWYRGKTVITVSVLTALVACSFFIPMLGPFRHSFFSYLRTIWWAITLGLFVGGVIDYYVPGEYVSLLFASGRTRSIINAVLAGFFLSACSHGILALAIQLHKKGASTPSVVAFLLASPWANFTITIMLFVFFGVKGLFIVASALLIAITTGFIFDILERKGLVEKNKNTITIEKGFSFKADIKKRLATYHFSFKTDGRGVYTGAYALAKMVLWWILIGMAIASFASAYIPTHIFHHYMGKTLLGIFVTLALATIIEVCSEGSAPMAFELFRQTGALGNSFVFLMAGVVTDYTEIGLLWHNVGRKTALWLPVVTVPQVLVLGILANILW